MDTLILTLSLDAASQAFFDNMRALHFPKERNYLKAHLTLFHKLTNNELVCKHLESLRQSVFTLNVSGLLNLGRGVAYQLESAELLNLHKTLRANFLDMLTPQDLQPLRPHITVQNKVEPAEARQLLNMLQRSFVPFNVTAVGLDVWTYLGGPWQHEAFYPFTEVTNLAR